ncbi:MAG: hypothetical protein ACM3ZA_09320 [Bacillota bacterium]
MGSLQRNFLLIAGAGLVLTDPSWFYGGTGAKVRWDWGVFLAYLVPGLVLIFSAVTFVVPGRTIHLPLLAPFSQRPFDLAAGGAALIGFGVGQVLGLRRLLPFPSEGHQRG